MTLRSCAIGSPPSTPKLGTANWNRTRRRAGWIGSPRRRYETSTRGAARTYEAPRQPALLGRLPGPSRRGAPAGGSQLRPAAPGSRPPLLALQEGWAILVGAR